MYIAIAYFNDNFLTDMSMVFVSEESTVEKSLSRSHKANLKAENFIQNAYVQIAQNTTFLLKGLFVMHPTVVCIYLISK